jgi:hypothetical protein
MHIGLKVKRAGVVGALRAALRGCCGLELLGFGERGGVVARGQQLPRPLFDRHRVRLLRRGGRKRRPQHHGNERTEP